VNKRMSIYKSMTGKQGFEFFGILIVAVVAIVIIAIATMTPTSSSKVGDNIVNYAQAQSIYSALLHKSLSYISVCDTWPKM
jgi:hypothetical protein